MTDDDQWIISAAAGEDHETVERDSGDLAWLTISRSPHPNLTSGSASDTRYEIAVDFVLSGGVLGTDYDLLCGQSEITSNTVSIPAGDTSVSLAIRPINDAVKEDDVSVTLTITGASSSGVFDSGGSGCCCAYWGEGGEFPIQQNGDPATVTIVDDDNWLLSVVANDNVATERMSDLDADNNPNTDEQDPAEFTFTRSGTRGGDDTCPVEMSFMITVTTHPAPSATPFEDYFFIVTDVHGGNEIYLEQFTPKSPIGPITVQVTDPITGVTTDHTRYIYPLSAAAITFCRHRFTT